MIKKIKDLINEDILNEERENEDEYNNDKGISNKVDNDMKINEEIKDELNEYKDLGGKLLIDAKFIEYNKKYSSTKKTWWPANVLYECKKYYPASHNIYLNDINKNML